MTISVGAESALAKDLGASVYLEDDPRKHKRGNGDSETKVKENLGKNASMRNWTSSLGTLHDSEKNASESLQQMPRGWALFFF